nr:hypothetical protein CFP56_77586 [Quercus suber]
MSRPNFLAQEDLPPVVLLLQRVLPEAAAAPKEDVASSRLLLEEEIDKFHFDKDEKERENPIIQLSDSKEELDKQSGAHSPRLINAHVDPSFEEDEGIDTNSKKGLRGFLTARNNWVSFRDAPKSQVPTNLPSPSSFPVTLVGLLP